MMADGSWTNVDGCADPERQCGKHALRKKNVASPLHNLAEEICSRYVFEHTSFGSSVNPFFAWLPEITDDVVSIEIDVETSGPKRCS